MDFALSPEQEEFRHTIRQFVTELSPPTKIREAVESEHGYDRGLWSRMSSQLGLPGLLVPEDYGGAGATMIEVVIAAEELGRGVVPSPFFATVALGVVPILVAGTEQQKKELLPEIAAGRRTCTVALAEPGGSGRWADVAMRAEATGDTVSLTGSKVRVIDGHTADTVIVAALPPESGQEPTLYVVDGADPGLTRTRLETLDLTRPMALLEFDAVPAIQLGGDASASAAQKVADLAKTVLAAEATGGADGALSMSVDYAKIRHQFNRPIGSFQAIKHRCAETAIELDAARAATLYAAYLAAEEGAELSATSAMALATAALAFDLAASWNVQIHGGIGYTWEHDAHLYYRRAKADRVLFGSPRDQWLELADRIGL